MSGLAPHGLSDADPSPGRGQPGPYLPAGRGAPKPRKRSFFLYYGTEPADLECDAGLLGGASGRRSREGRDDAAHETAGSAWRTGSGSGPSPGAQAAWTIGTRRTSGRRPCASTPPSEFRVVWIEYVFLSKILAVSTFVRAQGHRHPRRLFRTVRGDDRPGDQGPEWFATTPEMERKGLARADRVVAIQDRDADFFRTLGCRGWRRSAISPRPGTLRSVRPRNGILFIASDNSDQPEGLGILRRRRCSGRIEERLPGTSIRVAGRICRRIPESSPIRKDRRGRGPRRPLRDPPLWP